MKMELIFTESDMFKARLEWLIDRVESWEFEENEFEQDVLIEKLKTAKLFYMEYFHDEDDVVIEGGEDVGQS